jgi:hypothetical protein
VVSSGSAEAIAAAAESVSAGSLVALSADAVVLRSRKDALFRSLVMPGWGQAYNRQPVKAALVGGSFVALAGTAVAFHVLGTRAEDQYRTKSTAAALGGDPAATAASLRTTAESRYAWRNGLLLGAGAVWALGAVDAYVSGVDGDRLAVAVAPADRGLLAVVGGRFGR